MESNRTRSRIGYRFGWLSVLIMGVSVLLYPLTSAAAVLERISFAEGANNVLRIQLDFDAPPPLPQEYAIDDPPRILLDLPGVSNRLASKYHELGIGAVRNLTVLEANGRTRLVLKLERLIDYETQLQGNRLQLLLSAAETASVEERRIEDVDFRRGEQGAGQVIVTLSQTDIAPQVTARGDRIQLRFPATQLPPELHQRLDVTAFATPVQTIDASVEEGQALLEVTAQRPYDYQTYQADRLLVLEVQPVTEAPVQTAEQERFPYRGDRLSLNFRDIDIRSVLQLIAKFTDLNLVASDTVQGRITLRLQNVPWDQALALILKTKGLDQRRIGNVLLVAPAEEIAAYERQELEANQQVEQLAPLVSEFIQVRYAKASEIARLLNPQSGGSVGLLSARGRAMVDERTNTIFVQDTEEKLAEVRKALSYLDIPVRQVLIEARIVVARTNLSKELGIRWGGSAQAGKLGFGGSLREVTASANNELTQVALNPGLAVDLGAPATNASSFAFGYASSDLLIDLELSALESDGKGEVVSQPKVITADQKTARIQSGTEIPFQEATSSGATATAFKEAVLSLEVTPQITPDNRIIMDLVVNQDSVAELTVNGAPAIDTNSIETQVLVENGETVVLGGIFTSEVLETVVKTPFFGDLPYIGALFRRTERSNEKVELLVFITPKLIDDSLTAR